MNPTTERAAVRFSRLPAYMRGLIVLAGCALENLVDGRTENDVRRANGVGPILVTRATILAELRDYVDEVATTEINPRNRGRIFQGEREKAVDWLLALDQEGRYFAIHRFDAGWGPVRNVPYLLDSELPKVEKCLDYPADRCRLVHTWEGGRPFVRVFGRDTIGGKTATLAFYMKGATIRRGTNLPLSTVRTVARTNIPATSHRCWSLSNVDKFEALNPDDLALVDHDAHVQATWEHLDGLHVTTEYGTISRPEGFNARLWRDVLHAVNNPATRSIGMMIPSRAWSFMHGEDGDGGRSRRVAMNYMDTSKGLERRSTALDLDCPGGSGTAYDRRLRVWSDSCTGNAWIDGDPSLWMKRWDYLPSHVSVPSVKGGRVFRHGVCAS